MLGIESNNAPTSGAGCGLDTDAVCYRPGHKPIGIGFPQVVLGEEGEFVEVLNTLDVVGGDPLFFHLLALVGNVVIDIKELL